MRTRPDQRHIALEDIEQLRQLVDAGGAQDLADLGDAVVVATGLGRFRSRDLELKGEGDEPPLRRVPPFVAAKGERETADADAEAGLELNADEEAQLA